MLLLTEVRLILDVLLYIDRELQPYCFVIHSYI